MRKICLTAKDVQHDGVGQSPVLVPLLPESGPLKAQVCQVVGGNASYRHGQCNAPDPCGSSHKDCRAL